jgi:hypothetical protein
MVYAATAEVLVQSLVPHSPPTNPDSEPVYLSIPEGWLPVAGRSDVCVRWSGPEDGLVAFSRELLEMYPEVPTVLPWELEEIFVGSHASFYKRV